MTTATTKLFQLAEWSFNRASQCYLRYKEAVESTATDDDERWAATTEGEYRQARHDHADVVAVILGNGDIDDVRAATRRFDTAMMTNRSALHYVDRLRADSPLARQAVEDSPEDR